MSEQTPYENLTPDVMLDAVESLGLESDGRFIALNSYENRVYQVGLENEQPIIAKFYRPHRWSDEAILEEHSFSQELVDNEIPVIAPQTIDGKTLHEFEGYRFSLFTRHGGRGPELDQKDNRQWLGRFLGRIHSVGTSQAFQHRPAISIEAFFKEPSRFLLDEQWIPFHLETAYSTLIDDLEIELRAAWERAGNVSQIRLHGDCHPGNILWTDDGPHFVDLDDCRTGPAIQDLWMLLSGDREEKTNQLADIVEAYETFQLFNPAELNLIEALRTLRLVHYAAWLAKRWVDPAFPQAFPWFNSDRFWEEHILALREQAAALGEPALIL